MTQNLDLEWSLDVFVKNIEMGSLRRIMLYLVISYWPVDLALMKNLRTILTEVEENFYEQEFLRKNLKILEAKNKIISQDE